jgi:sugar lactone lactonase YvrE
LLYVADYRGRFVYSLQVQPDGSLKHRQEYFHLHVPYGANDAGPDGIKTDTEGRLYIATNMGVQVCDQPGRVNIILTFPPGTTRPSNIAFGGPQRDVLFATCGDKVFKRKLNAKGVVYYADPIKPPRPRL